MPKKLKLCVIGGGQHSVRCHLPALAHYRERSDGRLILSGIVDKVESKANAAVSQFGIARAYRDLEEMLRLERPDACLALTSVATNANTAIRLMKAGIPTLMEKPLGATLAEAGTVVEVAAATGSPIMVSMNRRFDPQIHAALRWVGDRQIRYLRATMARHNRKDLHFMEEVGIHLIDAIHMIAGGVRNWNAYKEAVGYSHWIQVRLEFSSGARGLVDFLPTTGSNAEVIELFGTDFVVEIRSAEGDRSWRAWSEGRLAFEEITPTSLPEFIANGSFAENEFFINQLLAGEPLAPTPSDVLPAMEICHSLGLIKTDVGEVAANPRAGN
jgi:predicted dehydrogenase